MPRREAAKAAPPMDRLAGGSTNEMKGRDPHAGEESWDSLPGMMLGHAARHPEAPLARHWRDGAWRRLSWGEFAGAVASVAAGLRTAGLAPGDRVLVVSENRPEFLVADNAIMASGAITVPTYVTNTAADHRHVLRDSGARTAIVSTARLAARVREAAGEGGLDLLVCMEACEGAVDWDALLATPADLPALLAEVAAIPAGRLACLIYTSGTGGSPKGVMLPHRALLANRAGVLPLIREAGLLWSGAAYLSFLPLSHSYEHTVGGFLFPSYGIEIVFSRGADRIASEFTEIEPHVVTTVPRLFEVLKGRIEASLEKAKPYQRALFDRALRLGLRKLDGPPLSILERVQDVVLERLVRAKVRARFGSRLAFMVSGGARLDPDLSGFFLALGVNIIQGYGQSEAGPVISVNLPWDNDRRTAGRPVVGVEARVTEGGEIAVHGDLLMDGYWGDAAATARALRPLAEAPDGPAWLHTGDVGRIADGRIHITDRMRDFIKTLGGDMVSPAKIEGLLMAEPEIAQAVIAGEGKPGLVALIVPSDGAEPDGAVRRVNGKLSGIERLRKWAKVEAFTVENGLLTPTMKVKRRVVLERHAATLAELH